MRTILLLLALLSASTAVALPPYFPLPAGTQVKDGSLIEEDYGEAAFKLDDEGGDPPVKRGRHWNFALSMDGTEGLEDNEVWARFKSGLIGKGWTIEREFDQNPFHATFRYQKGSKDAWGFIWVFAGDDLRADLVEIAPQTLKLKIAPPAASPEPVDAEDGDFPYLPPLPGSTRFGSQHDTGAFMVPITGQDEAQLVGSGSIEKRYRVPRVSNLQFVAVYEDALKAAGWTIPHRAQGLNQSDAVLVAHYAKGKRDLWAYLHHGGEEYAIRVADAGAQDLAAQLARDCRAALTGVLFDFNKSTLKAESDGVLARAADALKARPSLAVEVQGHTDNVGGDDYNLKLSDARARSVMQWLVARGVPATQIAARGYGRNRPIAPNDTDEGRARNRRVELACRGPSS